MKKNVKKNKTKICFISSSGGHYEQLMMLKPLMREYDSYIVTEKTNYAARDSKKEYYISQINRKEFTCIFKIICNFFKSFYIIIKEKPNIIISTGVLATIPTCLLGKLFKKKIIYIESFAKIDSPTETGKLMYKIADQFYVQWESMLKIYPNAIFKGGIY